MFPKTIAFITTYLVPLAAIITGYGAALMIAMNDRRCDCPAVTSFHFVDIADVAALKAELAVEKALRKHYQQNLGEATKLSATLAGTGGRGEGYGAGPTIVMNGRRRDCLTAPTFHSVDIAELLIRR
ncbi:hypothetical protein C7212DRAFT_348210 [Tuber magnatum]|uniref:Uncharacterized protein n=1 Tax=Tuber magnatum TaxID=42249 RepID=A0A317SDW5_9PEZI|nr:hypothetical protein C7212DRAFT_348210 [Tuber magnatum]